MHSLTKKIMLSVVTVVLLGLFLLYIVQTDENQNIGDARESEGKYTEIDKPSGIIFPKEYATDSANFLRPRAKDFWTPQEADIQTAESILTDCIDSSLLRDEDLSLYTRQYFGVVTEQSTNSIWVNAFIDSDNQLVDWKRQVVTLDDGGKDYFEVYVDLDSKSCTDFYIHGEA